MIKSCFTHRQGIMMSSVRAFSWQNSMDMLGKGENIAFFMEN